MAGLRERLGIITEARLRNLEQLRKKAMDCAKDRDGSATDSLALSLRFLGVSDFAMRGDVRAFRKQLQESGQLRKTLFERFNRGEPVSESYVAMTAYQSLFNLLAVGDFSCASEFASMMGGRPAIESKHDHPFDLAFGFALKHIVLCSRTESANAIARFLKICDDEDNRDFRGYALGMRAILEADSGDFDQALALILPGHIRQSKMGVFANTEDEVLCVWGLGLVNLARTRGLSNSCDESLIPAALVF